MKWRHLKARMRAGKVGVGLCDVVNMDLLMDFTTVL